MLRCGFILYAMIRITYILTIFIIQVSCTNLIQIPEIYGWISLVDSLVNFTFKLLTFLTLIYLMRKYNHFEFRRTSLKMLIYFLVDMLSYGMVIFIYTSQRLSWLDQEPVIIVCYLLNLPQIMIGYAILKLKDSKDVIQELSKLDYLIIVSVFQRHTLVDYEDHSGTFTSSQQQKRLNSLIKINKQIIIEQATPGHHYEPSETRYTHHTRDVDKMYGSQMSNQIWQ